MNNPINLDTLLIADEARSLQTQDDDVINATIGSIYDDQNQFHAFETVTQSIQALPHMYPYTKPEGLLHIGDLWWEHLSKGSLSLPKKHILTLGGTGALYLLYRSVATSKDIVINAVPTWNNNYQMLEHQGITYDTFYMFNKEIQYDLNTLKEKIDHALLHHEKVFVLVNDPSHNPSGYTMKKEEWIDLFRLIQSYQLHDRLFLINDMAYVDYADKNYDYFALINDHLKDSTMFLTFSGSKAFSLYGARVGMLVTVSNHVELLKEIDTKTRYIARSTYSLPSSFGFQVIEHLLKHQYELYMKELDETKALLKSRVTVLRSILEDKKIPYLPYEHGFFITVKTNQPLTVFQTLKEHKIFTIPVEFGIRFAVSSLTNKDINKLKEKLKLELFM
ncbi:MAG: aminotransferase class I/II-fold pyridoxal phosphate-dependent enzyme [Firmicutes bacterium]|nr:aminotransferase class I/II-fold pyridoxal phosphate-dependent enzyme [Bacillota bacterium]